MTRRALWTIGSCLCLAVALAIWIGVGYRRVPDRVFRIGWEIDAPEQVRGNDGQPTGFAVELVGEAARRRGIQLAWEYHSESSEKALRSGAVDLWPLMTITPERRKVVHISDPYVISVHSLLVLDDHPAKQAADLGRAHLGYWGLPINRAYLTANLPQAQLVSRRPVELVKMLCAKEIDGVFVEAHIAIATLLAGKGCPGQALRIIPTSGPHVQLGVASTFDAAAAADAIRVEIGRMADEGILAPLMAKWGYLPGRSEDSIQLLLGARRREQWLLAFSGLFVVLMALAAWQAQRARSESRRAIQSELGLRESERRFRGLLEHVRMAAIIVDLDGKVTFCNEFFLSATGWTRDEVLGHALTDFLVPEGRALFLQSIQAIAGQKPTTWTAETAIVRKQGGLRWFQSNALVLHDANGKPLGLADLAVDITEHRTLQEQYRQAQKMEGLGRLAGGVAHDFNNLLTVINGYSEIAYRQLSDIDPLRANIHEVRKAGARAAELTKQLLTFSRQQIIQAKPIDLNALVGDSHRMFKRLVGENIELETALDPRIGKVLADAGQIHQVLMNLLVNARDAMPEGGRVVIETADVEVNASRVAINAEATTGRHVVLSVCDTGTGMDAHTRERIFEPFFTTKPPGQGTGLGLATAYGIIKQAKGWIEVDTAVGEGTTFRVYLPRLQPEPDTKEEPTLGVDKEYRTETVLLVEDQEDVRRFATEVLSQYGYRVLTADCGTEALKLAEGHPGKIDLLLTDVVLPGMNGLELAEQLRLVRPGIPVLFTSGYTGEVGVLNRILDSGLAFLPKPYMPEAMALRVREAIENPVPLS